MGNDKKLTSIEVSTHRYRVVVLQGSLNSVYNLQHPLIDTCSCVDGTSPNTIISLFITLQLIQPKNKNLLRISHVVPISDAALDTFNR